VAADCLLRLAGACLGWLKLWRLLSGWGVIGRTAGAVEALPKDVIACAKAIGDVFLRFVDLWVRATMRAL